MRKKLSWKIKWWIVDIVCSHVKIGGHCGTCGKWEPDCLVPGYWRVTVCKQCIKESEEDKQWVAHLNQ